MRGIFVIIGVMSMLFTGAVVAGHLPRGLVEGAVMVVVGLGSLLLALVGILALGVAAQFIWRMVVR